jgi:prepilin-type N-terminal cleavage/methylation domain-containing protein
MPTKTQPNSRTGFGSRGFSLLELMITVALLTVILGVVVQAITQMQRRNFAETSKADTVQETRDFVDQMVRDVHDVGYPPGRVLANNPSCLAAPGVSCGLWSFSNTQIVYEGALDGGSTVYRVFVQLIPGPSGNCPCILRRGVIDKTLALGGAQPPYFTEVNGVLNSGNGAGGHLYPISLSGPGSYSSYANANVFEAYDLNSNPITACDTTTVPDCSSIRSLQITANVTSTYPDPKTKMFAVYSVTSKARLNNNAIINP